MRKYLFNFWWVMSALLPASAQLINDPLLQDFDDILFIERSTRTDLEPNRNEPLGGHMCDQYYGHNARKGGGMYILKNFKSGSPELVNVVEGLRVPNGTNEGMLLSEGAFLSPDLSWDGKTVVFAWASGGTRQWTKENRFNIFKVNIDGTGLVRLTDGDYDDFDPVWLPSGRIVFISTRRGGYGRCHGRPVPTFTMFSMKDDGSDIICIDYHETNEWHPSVDNNGMLIYSRWDYIDRDFSAAHHVWICNPDGRNPRSYHGNYSEPLTTQEGNNWIDGRERRPWAEYNCRAIPNSEKYVCTAGPHHAQAFGSLILIDISVEDDNKMSQVTRLTPDADFPEAEPYGINKYGNFHQFLKYGTAWPLSESRFLCNFENGLYVMDDRGNKERFYQSRAQGFRPIDPIPVKARTKPPVLATFTNQGENFSENVPNATISVMDVNITDEFGTLPPGVKIEHLRVVQIFPKSTPIVNQPRIGYADQGLARMPLGIVPVEEDGSVYFKAPIEKEIYFQLLDENGMAVQSMRSGTYVHSGEQLSCVGCHEDKWESPKNLPQPIATSREPSTLEPEVENQYPFNFHRNVKPVLESKCAPCHSQRNVQPTNWSYGALESYAFFFHGGPTPLSRNHGGSRVLPGNFGALGSRMGKALLNDTHQALLDNGDLTQEEFRRITLWLDLNSDELNAYQNENNQRSGRVVWPEFDIDPDDPVGAEDRIVEVSATRSEKLPKMQIASFQDIISIKFPLKSDFKVSLVDVRGNVKYSAAVEDVFRHSFTAQNLSTGVYILKVVSDNYKSDVLVNILR